MLHWLKAQDSSNIESQCIFKECYGQQLLLIFCFIFTVALTSVLYSASPFAGILYFPSPSFIIYQNAIALSSAHLQFNLTPPCSSLYFFISFNPLSCSLTVPFLSVHPCVVEYQAASAFHFLQDKRSSTPPPPSESLKALYLEKLFRMR